MNPTGEENPFRDDVTQHIFKTITSLIESNVAAMRSASKNTRTTSEREAMEAEARGLELALKCVRYSFGLDFIVPLAAN